MRHSLAFALAVGALFCASAAQAAVQITIDKSTQQMTVERDGRPLYQWPVSTGRPGFDTPSGRFKAFRMLGLAVERDLGAGQQADCGIQIPRSRETA